MILPLGLALTLATGLSPALGRWAAGHERHILAEGTPLTAGASAFAGRIGIEEPAGVRFLEVERIPLPLPFPLVEQAARWGFPVFEPAGMALGRGIYILPGRHDLLPHELVHVLQYQRLGGIHPFMRRYVVEILFHGYLEAPLEVEARELSR